MLRKFLVPVLAVLAFTLLLAMSGSALAQTAEAPAAAPALNDGDVSDPVEDNFFSISFDEFGRKFPWRLGVDILSVGTVILLVYYPAHRKKDYFFTFFMFNIVVFFVTLLLKNIEFSAGAAFGLFAVFSLLRYRTEDIDAKDMTYLLTVIALGLLTAVNRGNLFEMVLVNAIIIFAAWLIDGQVLMRTEEVKNIQYDDISKIKPESEAELIKDLRERTGLDIHRVEVGRVDYLRDAATVRIYYYEKPKKRY